MTDTGLTFPGTAGTTSRGGTSIDWTNPNNCLADDSSYATSAPDGGATLITYFLNATNFGFSIPSGATINGVTCEVQARVSNDAVAGNMRYIQAFLLKAGAQTGTNTTTITNLTTSDANKTIGSTSNLWGASLTDSDVNASNFGVQVSWQSTDVVTRTCYVDYIKLSINYTAGGGAVGGGPVFRGRAVGYGRIIGGSALIC